MTSPGAGDPCFGNGRRPRGEAVEELQALPAGGTIHQQRPPGSQEVRRPASPSADTQRDTTGPSLGDSLPRVPHPGTAFGDRAFTEVMNVRQGRMGGPSPVGRLSLSRGPRGHTDQRVSM